MTKRKTCKESIKEYFCNKERRKEKKKEKEEKRKTHKVFILTNTADDVTLKRTRCNTQGEL